MVGEQQREVQANYSIEIKDPVFKRITAVTDSFTVSAHGVFHPGTTMVKGYPVQIEDGTTFDIKLTLPIDDPEKIETANASGTLITSKKITVAGSPLPDSITLEHGKATGKVDLVRMIGIYLYNSLQNQSVDKAGGGEVRNLLDSITVNSALLKLKPNASFDLGHLHVNTAPGSKVEFTDLQIDRSGDYHGNLLVGIKFDKGCKYEGKKVDMGFNAGDAEVKVEAVRKNDILELHSTKGMKPLNLKDAVYSFGGDKQCAVTGDAVVNCREFVWQKKDMSGEWTSHAVANMDLQGARLTLTNPKLTLVAQFKAVIKSLLQVDLSPKEREYQWSTDKKYPAETLDMNFKRPNSSVQINAAQANVGPVALDKKGDLNFSLDDGTALLKQIAFDGQKRKLKLICGKNSQISITQGKDLNIAKNSEGLHYDLPLTLKVPSAELQGTKSRLQLAQINGRMDVKVEDEMNLDSDVDFEVANDDLFGNESVAVKVRGISMSGQSGHSQLELKKCSLVIPQDAITKKITAELPKEKTFDLEKVVLNDQKWRYRNAIITKLTVRNLGINDLKCTGPNTENFHGQADVLVTGTIEKSGVMAIFKKTDNWETKPWSASGTVNGEGVVNFKYIPNSNLAASKLNYNLALTLPAPDDVDVDWSQVSNSLLAKAEHSQIVGMIKKMKPKTMNYNGTLSLFSKKNKKFENWKVTQLMTGNKGNDVELTFHADLNM